MTANTGLSDAAGSPWSLTRWGLRADVVCIWSLFCCCYWFYPLWSHGKTSVHLKFVVLAAYTVAYLFLLSLWNRRRHCSADRSAPATWRSAFSTSWGLASLVVLLVAAGLQFRETLLPILSGPDEPYRVAAAIDQWTSIASTDAGTFRIALALVSPALLWFAGLVLLSSFRSPLTRLAAGGGLFIAGLAVHHHTMLAVGTRWGDSPRWPPLGTLFEVFSLSVFGLGEAAARLPSLFFYVLTGVVLFRLVAREASPPTAFVAVVAVMSSPAFFTQGQLASRETVGAFFMTAAAYFLVRRCHGGGDGDLGWSIALTLAAYLSRRPAIAFFAVILAVEAVRLWRQRTEEDPRGPSSNPMQLLLAAGVFVAGAFPWMFSTRTIRPFELSPSNWFDLGLVIAYPSRFPFAMGLIVTILGIAGIVGVALHRRILGMVALLWLAVVYVLLTSDMPAWIPTWRFLALISPPWALLAAEGFRMLSERPAGWARPALLAVCVVGAVFSVVAWSSCGLLPSWLPGASCRAEIPRYPFDRVVSWLGERGQDRVVVTPATYWQTPFEVYASFQGMAAMAEHVPPYGTPAPPLTVRDISSLCRSVPVDLVVVPSQLDSGQWVPKFMASEQVSLLVDELDPESRQRAVFTHGRFRLELFPCPSQ